MPKPKQRENAAQPSDQSETKARASDLTEQPLTATSGEAAAAAEAGPVAATAGFTPGMAEPGFVEGPPGEEGPAGAVATPPAATGTTESTATGEAAHRQRPMPPMPPMPNPVAGLRMAAGIVRGFLPPRDRLIFYGGLGAATALGAVDLPVAVAIGAGVWVATHRHRDGQPRPVHPVTRESRPAEPVTAPTSGR